MLPQPKAEWALDSGGFTELGTYGAWYTTPREYIAEVHRYTRSMPYLLWVAPQDWMCEPSILAKTRLTVADHQRLTVENFLRLRHHLGEVVIPVLQGWTRDDYLRCVELYEECGVDLAREHTVGLGTVCRRQDTAEAAHIVRSLDGIRLHGFGIKITGLRVFGDALVSADSMAWSYRARNDHPLQGCTHKSCANCLRYALRWRTDVVDHVLGQQRMEIAQ